MDFIISSVVLCGLAEELNVELELNSIGLKCGPQFDLIRIPSVKLIKWSTYYCTLYAVSPSLSLSVYVCDALNSKLQHCKFETLEFDYNLFFYNDMYKYIPIDLLGLANCKKFQCAKLL